MVESVSVSETMDSCTSGEEDVAVGFLQEGANNSGFEEEEEEVAPHTGV